MRIQANLVLLLTFVFPTGVLPAHSQNPVYALHVKPERATAVIMATSNSIHHRYAGNQEIYLADVSMKGKEHVLAKLVDTYPFEEPAIRRAVLVEHHPLHVTLLRNMECDARGREFFLQSDPANIFDVGTSEALKEHAAEVIPCFDLKHQATRLVKQGSR